MEFSIYSLILIYSIVAYSEAIRFMISAQQKKCLKEEIHKDVLVTGDYEVSEAPGQQTHLEVTDSKGHILAKKDDAKKGKFAFTTEEYDMFDVCFESKTAGGNAGSDVEVFLNMKHGVEAKSYEDIAKAEKLKPMEVELKRLEDLSKSIVEDFDFMRRREEEMRDTNESTHSRVMMLSIVSVCCLFALATWQVFYLRKYFKAKKLID